MKERHFDILEALRLWPEDAHGQTIIERIERVAGRRYVISTMHLALSRLEANGLVASRLEEAPAGRAPRNKRLFILTDEGRQVLGTHDAR